MSGHSKWATTKHKKGAADAKRGKLFSKLVKNVSLAAREGGDPMSNFKLRIAIDKAKAANVPKDNIDRAIARATGAGGEAALETVLYEGMGPGGAALLIEAVTDNKNRTVGNLKTIFGKLGGNMEAKVLWQFERKGVVRVADVGARFTAPGEREDFELRLIDAGAEEIDWEDGLEVICAVDALQKVEEAVASAGLEVESADLEYIAKEKVQLSAEDEEKLERFIETLDDDDDVTNVFTNAA